MTKSRLETFSDGVIAIVITLLVLEIHVPEVGEGESLADALWDQWPSYAAYLVSFITIGVMWLNHHRMFDQVVRVDGVLLLLNLYLLLWMAIIPFPTSVVALYLDEGGRNASTALAVYGGVILMNAIAFTLLFGWITHDDRLIGQPIPAAVRSAARRRFGLGLAVYSVAFALSWVSAPLALALHAAMALYYAFDQASVMTGGRVPSTLGG
jgi:uncharacterized membrane protein